MTVPVDPIDVPCPCGAAPGEPCRTPRGREAEPHAPRKERFALTVIEAKKWNAWHEACGPKGAQRQT